MNTKNETNETRRIFESGGLTLTTKETSSTATETDQTNEREVHDVNEFRQELDVLGTEARMLKKRREAKLEEIEQLETEITKSDELLKKAQKARDQDEEVINKITAMRRDYNSAQSYQQLMKFHKIFEAVFNNMRSRTVELGELPNTRWKLTVGKFGFGKRHNVQSQPLSPEDVKRVAGNKKWVIKAMKDNGLKKWAKKFERFTDKFPANESTEKLASRGNDLIVPLKHPVLIPTALNRGEDPREYNEMRMISKTSVTFLNDGKWQESSWITVFDKTLTTSAAFPYLQLRRNFQHIAEFLENEIQPITKKWENSISEMREEFANELLVDSI